MKWKCGVVLGASEGGKIRQAQNRNDSNSRRNGREIILD